MSFKKINGIIEKTIIAVFIVLVIIFIYQIITKILGHSPTDTQILYVGFGIVVSYLLIMGYNLGIFVGKVNEFMKTTKSSFRKLDQDISKIDRLIQNKEQHRFQH